MSSDARFTQISYGPHVLVLIPAACLVLLVLIVRRTRGQVPRSTLAWLFPDFVGLIAPCVWYAMGIGTSDFVALILYCALILGCAIAVLSTDKLFPELSCAQRNRRALIATAICGTCALEFTCNDTFFLMLPWFWALEIAFALGLVAILWLVSGRRGIGAAVGLVPLLAIGIAQHFVLEFRGTSILPSDTFAAGTALSVSLGYTYGLSSGMLGGFGALMLGFACCSLIKRPQDMTCRVRALDMARAVGVALAIAALVIVPDYGTVFGADIDYWWSKDWYGRQGFLPSFVYAWQDLDISKPSGYTKQRALEAREELARRASAKRTAASRRAAASKQFQGMMPNIVVIQNETFCDLSIFDGLQNGYEGPTFWNTGMSDALARGNFAVSVFGGGTCNTEFEFLTGNSLAFVGTAKYPFSMYDLSVTQSLPRQLNDLGYLTVGMHPNLPTNWNRDRAYEDLGFEEMLFMDEFEGAEEYHTHVSDAATYDKTLELLEETEEPAFVFDVTMQNHSGYDTGSIPNADLPGYMIEGLSEDDNFQVNEFVACIAESDHAFQELIERLREFDEPTVVVMYGDHHPWLSTTLNDLIFLDEDDLTHAERIHQTSYIVWANYDVAGTEPAGKRTDDTSADMLATQLLDTIGAPLSDFQKAQLGARIQVRALNAYGFLGDDGAWHSLDDPGDYEETLSLLELVEFLNFGSKV